MYLSKWEQSINEYVDNIELPSIYSWSFDIDDRNLGHIKFGHVYELIYEMSDIGFEYNNIQYTPVRAIIPSIYYGYKDGMLKIRNTELIVHIHEFTKGLSRIFDVNLHDIPSMFQKPLVIKEGNQFQLDGKELIITFIDTFKDAFK